MKSKYRTKSSHDARPQTLLLVDDDPSVRIMLTRVLASEGYRVWPWLLIRQIDSAAKDGGVGWRA